MMKNNRLKMTRGQERSLTRQSYLPFLFFLGLFWTILGTAWGNHFLSAEQAFQFSAQNLGNDRLELQWKVAPGYHLYRQMTHIEVAPANVHLGPWQLPPGKLLDDPAFGKVQVLEGTNRVIVPYTIEGAPPKSIVVTSTYQGCADAGVCYPQQQRTITLSLAPVAATHQAAVTATQPANSAKEPGPVSNAGRLAESLDKSFFWTLVLFFVSGLGLAFTPCVFPMIPILSGIIVGQRERPNRLRAFMLSLAYVLGMSLSYTIAGVLAALSGAYLQAFFQNPWVIAAFAAIFVLLALSMFGFYELQMPVAIQSRLARVGKGGHLLSSLVLGALSALIVGPCVAAPLAGGLLFISQSGNVLLGALALFVLSLGMGFPLLIIGSSAAHFLPKAGPWMDAIKAVFGVLMLGVAIWFLSRILPGPVTLALWALLAIFAGVYLRALESASVAGWTLFRKALGIVLLAWGLVMGVGALEGQSDPFAPLPTSHTDIPSVAPMLHFQRVRSPAELDQALAQARGKPVLVDYWASWCVECARMDQMVFQNPKVRKALAGYGLIRVDVTENDQDSRQLLRQHHLAGPPAFLLISPSGKLQAVQEGFLGPDAFVHWLHGTKDRTP